MRNEILFHLSSNYLKSFEGFRAIIFYQCAGIRLGLCFSENYFFYRIESHHQFLCSLEFSVISLTVSMQKCLGFQFRFALPSVLINGWGWFTAAVIMSQWYGITFYLDKFGEALKHEPWNQTHRERELHV